MGITLGPGGRALLVLAGIAVVYLAFARAGWLPAGAPSPFRPRPAGPPPISESSFAWDREARCAEPLRVAAVNRVAAARVGPVEGRVAVEAAPTARVALERLATGAVGGAVVSLSELAAGWDLAAQARPEVAVEIAGTPDDLALLTQGAATLADLAGKRVAAVPGSAEEFRLMGALAQAGLLDRVQRQAAGSPEDAVAQVARGVADAAVAPVQHVAQAARMGQSKVLPLVAPVDPIVLVLARGASGCAGRVQLLDRAGLQERARAIFPDPRLSLQDAPPPPPPDPGEIAAAWRAAARVRGGPPEPPLALVIPAEVP